MVPLFMKHAAHISFLGLLWFLVGHGAPSVALAQVTATPAIPVSTQAFESIEQLESYLASNADDHQARREYADRLFEAGRFREAAAHYEIFLQHLQGAPDTVHRYLMAIAGYPGDNLRGERAVMRYLNVYPTDYELYMRLGYFRLWQAEYHTALEAFQQALRLNPDYAPVRDGIVEAQAGIALNARLENPPPTRVSDPSEYPQLDERRYRFIHDLMNYRRYYAAYEQLMLLAERHDHTGRWLALYTEIDRSLIESTGSTPAYSIDRYTYLLSNQPDNRTVRFALVDALMDAGRIEEAYEVLLNVRRIEFRDSGFVDRLTRLDERRSVWVDTRIEQLEAELADLPEDESRLSELASYYQVARRPEDAVCVYEKWLSIRPDSREVQSAYARLLLDLGRIDDAGGWVDRLLEGDEKDVASIRLYRRIVLAGGGDAERAIAFVQAHLEQNPEDVDAMLDLAELRLYTGDPDAADVLLRRAFTRGEPSDRVRLLDLDRQVEMAYRRRDQQGQERVLATARMAAQSGDFQEAIAGYEAYFELKGVRTRPVLEEMARAYSLSGDYVTAISIYEALQDRGYAPSLAREIARNRYWLLDHAGAIETLETLIAQHPNDAEARELLQQIYIEVQRFAQADSIYHDRVEDLADNTRLRATSSERLSQRINLIERAIDTDYVGLIVPVSQYIRARGSITSYEHWGQGLMTQVTLPAQPRPFMLTAGLVSHFLNGTRRLVPGTPVAFARINQVIAGTYFDLEEPASDKLAGYTNRIWLQGGVFDYSGTRTTGFGEIRYLRRDPGKYRASIGARTTEGALSLWSPAGGEFGLRLTQFDVRARSSNVLPDSLIRVRAELALNLVKGRSDSTLAQQGRNTGTTVRLESSLRIFPYTYLGLAFNNINYRYTLDTYFSPRNYRAYDIWLEYEKEVIQKWLLRVRGTTGLVSYRRGAFAARIESDLIYRFSPHLAISVSGSAGNSVRFIDGEESLRDNRFKTVLFTGALYWTL